VKRWVLLALTVLFLAAPAAAWGGEYCSGRMVGQWRRSLARAADAAVHGWLDGKTLHEGLGEPLVEIAQYSAYLVPCFQLRGKDWDPALAELIEASQKEGLPAEALPPRLLLVRLRRAGADPARVQSLWEGRSFKVLP